MHESRATQTQAGMASASLFSEQMLRTPQVSEADKKTAWFIYLLAIGGDLFPLFPLGWLVPLAVLVFVEQRSSFVLFHLHQVVLFHLGALVPSVTLAMVGAALSLVGKFHLAITMIAAFWLFVVVYTLFIGLKAKEGKWAKMLWLGDRIMEMKPLVR